MCVCEVCGRGALGPCRICICASAAASVMARLNHGSYLVEAGAAAPY